MVALTRRAVLAGLSATGAMSGAMPAVAQPGGGAGNWPNRPITMVHGLPPGGSVDGIVRIISEALGSRLGQSVVVDARPGAGATLAATQVARAAPDGYTLLGIPSGHAVSAAMYRKLGYRPVEDFSYISTVTEYPFVLVTHPEHPAKTLKDLVALARLRKEPLLYGGPNGTLQHLSVELLGRVADIRVQLVPYRGSPQAVADLLGKRLDFMLDPPTAHLAAIKSGQLRALATTGAARFFALPDVPTVAEQGIKDFVIGSWQGVIGPAGLPDDIVKRLIKEIAAVPADPAVVARLKALGNDPKASTPEEFRSRVASDIDRWTKVIAAANIERI
jgi:tripartite-type tricarboxylate transporter receptor subunit TctC